MIDTVESFILLTALFICGSGAYAHYVDPKIMRELEDYYVEGQRSKEDLDATLQKLLKKKNRMKTFLCIGAIILTVGYYLHTNNGMNSILFFAFVLCTIGAIFISVSYQDSMILFRKRMKGLISEFALVERLQALEGKKSLKYTLTAAAVILGWELFF